MHGILVLVESILEGNLVQVGFEPTKHFAAHVGCTLTSGTRLDIESSSTSLCYDNLVKNFSLVTNNYKIPAINTDKTARQEHRL